MLGYIQGRGDGVGGFAPSISYNGTMANRARPIFQASLAVTLAVAAIIAIFSPDPEMRRNALQALFPSGLKFKLVISAIAVPLFVAWRLFQIRRSREQQ